MLQCEVIGNLGNDAEIKDFNGKKYVSFSIAHSDFNKEQSGSRAEQPVWISVLWYGDGGGLFNYLKKGNKVFVRGKQKIKLYTDKNGTVQYSISINANEVILCGARSETDRITKSNAQTQQQNTTIDTSNDLPF